MERNQNNKNNGHADERKGQKLSRGCFWDRNYYNYYKLAMRTKEKDRNYYN